MQQEQKYQIDLELADVLKKHDCTYISPIDEGGSATCHLVFNTKYNTSFVIKRIKKAHTECGSVEVTALMNLSSPDIINLYDFEFTENDVYLFLEYCSNGSLQQYVKKNGPLKGKQLLGVLFNILNGIEYIHSQKCCHLDIKPSNILIDHYGRTKLADFGISRFSNQFNKNVEEVLSSDEIFSSFDEEKRKGTLVFMAPELLKARRGKFDPFSADIWALGVTFYYIWTGGFPWVMDSNADIIKSIQTGSIVIKKELPHPKFAKFLLSMFTMAPGSRPTASHLLQSPIFDGIKRTDGYITFQKKSLLISKSQMFTELPSPVPDSPIVLSETSHSSRIGSMNSPRSITSGGSKLSSDLYTASNNTFKSVLISKKHSRDIQKKRRSSFLVSRETFVD